MNSQTASTFARCRALAAAALAAAAAEVRTAAATPLRPTKPLIHYKPDLSALPPGLAQSLQHTIDAIERRAASHPGDTVRV